MLRALFLLLMNLALAAMATAQNLVRNPSFEDTTYCVGWPPPQLEASFWYTANTATPDIWNCDTINPCGYHVMDPNDDGIQILGYKSAFDGSRFAGGFHWYGPGGSNTREYLMSQLIDPLQAGQRYRVAAMCARPAGYNAAIDHIDAYFGPDSIHESYPTTLPYVPQIQLRSPQSTYLADTAWVQLADTFTAIGDERWIVLGTFLDADEVDGVWLGWGSFPGTAYYFLDLISVEMVVDQSSGDLLPQAPRLVANSVQIVWMEERGLERLGIFDSIGKLVWEYAVAGGTRIFVVPPALPAGSYVAVARDRDSLHKSRFIK